MLINFCHSLVKKCWLLISAILIFINNNCLANFTETENIYNYTLLNNSYLSNRGQSNKELQNPYSKNNYDKKYGVENNSQLFLEAKKLIEEQQSISLKIKLESELSSNASDFRIDIDESFLLLENKLGNLEIGATKASNQKMKAGVANINNSNNFAIANGNYLKNIILPNFNSLASTNKFNYPQLFITIPQLPIGHNGEGIGAIIDEEIENGEYKTKNFNKYRIKILRSTSFNGMEDANKISYYAPRISNLQLAISYTRDSSKSYFSTSVFNNKTWRIVDIITANANYLNYLENDLSYELSASIENGRTKNNHHDNIKRRNLLAFDFGATVNYFGFTLASNAGFWGNSLQSKNNCNNANFNLNTQNQDNFCSYKQDVFKPNYYALGLGYKISHFSFGISHFNSQLQKNYYSADALNLGYKINKDTKLYLEVIDFSFRTKNIPNINLSKNNGLITLTGINLKF